MRYEISQKEVPMNIKKTKELQKKLENLFQINEINKVISDFNLNYLYESKEIAKSYEEPFDYFQCVVNYLKLPKDYIDFLKENKVDQNFNVLDETKYNLNPYVRNIHLETICEKEYAYKQNTFIPYEGFIYKDIEVDENFLEKTWLGYFQKPFAYPSLLEKQSIWMLITPHEINTMEEAIQKAKGKVITFGLGLGYFTYMCSLKENVSSITIIERNPQIIYLFNQYILPQFEHKEKIKIIQDDALHYLSSCDFDDYYAFVDLYKDVDDGLPIYIQIKQLESLHIHTTFDYWIEKSMLIMLRRCLITTLYEEYYKIDLDSYSSIYDAIIQQFKIILKDYIIEKWEDVVDLLSFKTIKKLILKLKVNELNKYF